MSNQTLVILKPDTLERKLVSIVLNRFESAGLHIAAMKYLRDVPASAVISHYGPAGCKHGPNVLRRLVSQLTGDKRPASFPGIIVMVLEGPCAIASARRIAGEQACPLECEFGTIRRDYGRDTISAAEQCDEAVNNLVHTSSSIEDAQRELAIWLPLIT